jgi:hypothetical protein
MLTYMLIAYIIRHMKIGDYLHQNNIPVIAFAKRVKKSRQTVYEWIWGEKRPIDDETYALIFKETDGQVTPNDFYNVPINHTLTHCDKKATKKGGNS